MQIGRNWHVRKVKKMVFNQCMTSYRLCLGNTNFLQMGSSGVTDVAQMHGGMIRCVGKPEHLNWLEQAIRFALSSIQVQRHL